MSLTKILVSLFQYSARRLIGSRIIESAAYCNKKLLAHLYLDSTQKLNHSVIIITFMLAQSDSIKRRALYLHVSKNCCKALLCFTIAVIESIIINSA